MATKGLPLLLTGAELIEVVRLLEPEAERAWRRLTADWSPSRRYELLSERRLRYVESQARLPIRRAEHGTRLYTESDLLLFRLYVRLVAVHQVPVGDVLALIANFAAALRTAFQRPPRAGTLVLRGKQWELLPPRYPARDSESAIAVVALESLVTGTTEAIAVARQAHDTIWTGARWAAVVQAGAMRTMH